MDVFLSVASDEVAESLAVLTEWLRGEPEFRGRIKAVERPPQPGELGTVTDALSVAMAGGGALTVLAGSLRAFFAQPRRSDVRITIHTDDGRSVEVDAKRVNDVETLIRSTLGEADV